MVKLTVLLFSVFYGYAVLRYHVGKGVGWDEFLFVLNKSFAWLSLTMIALTVLKQSTLDKVNSSRRSLGNTGFFVAFIHILLTILLFNQERYPKFYLENEIDFQGWFMISIGIISSLIYAVLFAASMMNRSNDSSIFRLGKYAIVLNAVHPLLIGFQGWFSPNEWPFLLPPITLLAVMMVLLIFALRVGWKK